MTQGPEKYKAPIEGTPFHVGEAETPRYFPQGQETETRPVDVAAVEGGQTTRVIKGGFILKKSRIYGLTIEVNDELIKEAHEKLMKLKEINALQKKAGGHQFNLPNTMRLIKDKDGRLAILETDLSLGGKRELIDLKYANEWDFDEDTMRLIVDTIKLDMKTAAEYKVNLSDPQNLFRPLDTWCLVVDKETGEKKVFVLDVGTYVKIDDTEEDLDASAEKTNKALAELSPGPELKRFSDRAILDPDQENY